MTAKTRLMMIDDDSNVLSSFRRSLGRSYDLTLCESGQEALAIVSSSEEFPVIVTDMRMPGMNGIEFVRRAREIRPHSVYIMLTGNADQQTAIDAINKGQVFRFLNKPCSHDIVESTIEASLRQYALVQAERTLLRQTLSGSVRLLIDALTVSDPEIARATQEVRHTVRQLSPGLGLSDSWQLSIASSLVFLGTIAVPETSEQCRMSDGYLLEAANIGSKLIANIPRLEDVARMVQLQRETGPVPDGLGLGREYQVQLSGRLLRFAVDWHRESCAANGNRRAGFRAIANAAPIYDPRLLEAAQAALSATAQKSDAAISRSPIVRPVGQLRPGDIVDRDIMTSNKLLLVKRGQELSGTMIQRIRSFDRAGLLDVDTIHLRDHKTYGDAA